MDTHKHLNRLQTLLDAMDQGPLLDATSRLLAFGTANAIVDELRKLNVEDYGEDPYTSEKLDEYLDSIKALVNLEEDGGHSENQHIVWAEQALTALGSKLCFGVWEEL